MIVRTLNLIILSLTMCTAVSAQQKAGDPLASAAAQPAPPGTDLPPLDEDEESLAADPIRLLLREISLMREELIITRQALAEAQLEADQARAELNEMRQFIADREQYGRDFQAYRAVREAAEREARQQELQAARERREIERARREARRLELSALRARADAVEEVYDGYRRRGFTPLGMNVYASRMAFYYETDEVTPSRVVYRPIIGRTLRVYPTTAQVNYAKMIISGSVLNADEVTRNIGVAITFFDENGNQVGHEIVQVNNARPDVPYPFTSTIQMALNRPFASSSMYVLYADEAFDDGVEPEVVSPVPAPGPATPAEPYP